MYYWFGRGPADWATAAKTVGGQDNIPQFQPGAILKCWTMQGELITDLRDEFDTPISEVPASLGDGVNGPGTWPAFQAPVPKMLVSAGDGPRMVVVTTDIPDILQTHIEDVGAHTPGGGVSGAPGMLYVVASNADLVQQLRADYLCTGVSDNLVIQQAIEAAGHRGVDVLLSQGTFIIEAPLTIDRAVTIRGSGRDTSTLRAGDGLNDYVIRFASGSPDGVVAARITDLRIDGRCDAQTAGGGIAAYAAVQCSFERVHVINAYNWGLILGGITGGAFGHHNRVRDCLFDATITSAGYGGGVWCTSSDENWFSGSDFEYLGGESAPVGTAPIALYDQAGLQKINDANFVGGRKNCIHIRLQDTKLTQVTGCTFDGSAGDSVFATGSRHVIANNIVTSPGDQGTTPASGIHLEYAARGIIVTGNVLETSNAAGKTRSLIRERGDGDAGGNLIANNSLWRNSAPTVAMTEFGGAGSVTTNNITNPPT